MNTLTPSENVRIEDGYRIIECAPVKLGRSTYAVKIQRYDDPAHEDTIWLTGARGAEYTLVPESVCNDTGRYRVISFASGAPLRSRGNEIRVTLIGDILEETPAPRLPYLR